MSTTSALLAARAHYGQRDKKGLPYLTHPMRALSAFDDETLQIIAVLHDVIEDSDLTDDDLRAAGCSERMVDAVVALSHLPPEPREQYYERVKANADALTVKLVDIEDNARPDRLHYLDEATQDRLRRKYELARRILGVPPEPGGAA